MTDTTSLTRFAWLSILAAVITIALKLIAFWLTDSVGLLSDALESGANLVAAIIALIALTVAAQPPDDDHLYGHYKAEYFSSGVEGALIVVAAVTIVVTAVNRLFQPVPLAQLDIGLIVSALAAVVNFVTARILLQAGQSHRSVALEADARHLLTDVWTSVGVIIGVGAVVVTGWAWLDPLIAIFVAVHILRAGAHLVQGSVLGLMDTALPPAEVAQLESLLQAYEARGATFHALRTRRSGKLRFVSVHVQVPGAWTVQDGHSLLEEIESEVRAQLAPVSILTHLEPIEDPVSWQDIHLARPQE